MPDQRIEDQRRIGRRDIAGEETCDHSVKVVELEPARTRAMVAGV